MQPIKNFCVYIVTRNDGVANQYENYTNINLKPYNGLEQLRRKEAKRRVGNIGRIENDIGIKKQNHRRLLCFK